MTGMSYYNTKEEIDLRMYYANKAINANRDYWMGYFVRGFAWNKKDNPDMAIADYSKVIELKPDYAFAYYNRGIVWSDKGHYDKALPDYTKAIELKPDYAAAYNSRGVAWFEKSDFNKGIADYRKAVQIKSDYHYPYYNLGRVYFYKRDYLNAKKSYEKYVALKTNKSDYHTELAKANLTEIEKLLANSEFKKISELVSKIKRLLLFKDGLITHYTSLSTVKSLILENSPFRLSEGAFLNDTSEGRELLQFLDIAFSTQKDKGKTMAELFAQKPFIGSFVTDSKFDDLTLWRMYGKEEKEEARGCAITIDMVKLVDKINNKLTPAKELSSFTINAEDINFYMVA